MAPSSSSVASATAASVATSSAATAGTPAPTVSGLCKSEQTLMYKLNVHFNYTIKSKKYEVSKPKPKN